MRLPVVAKNWLVQKLVSQRSIFQIWGQNYRDEEPETRAPGLVGKKTGHGNLWARNSSSYTKQLCMILCLIKIFNSSSSAILCQWYQSERPSVQLMACSKKTFLKITCTIFLPVSGKVPSHNTVYTYFTCRNLYGSVSRKQNNSTNLTATKS